MCPCPRGEQGWKWAGHRGRAWRNQTSIAPALSDGVVALSRSSVVIERVTNLMEGGITVFRIGFFFLTHRPLSPFSCLLSLRSGLVGVYYRSVSLWLLEEGMGLVVWKSRQNATCKMWAKAFSRTYSPEPDVTVTGAPVRNVQRFFLDMKWSIRLLLVRFWVANLELGLHKVAYESKLKKGVPWTLASWNFWIFLGFTYSLLLENLWSGFSLWARSSQLISSLSHCLIKWNPSYCPAFCSVMQYDAYSSNCECRTMSLLPAVF